MSYFHTGIRTIIGAEAFHCPVRDGKEWDHLAMVIRLKRVTHQARPGRSIRSVDFSVSIDCGCQRTPSCSSHNSFHNSDDPPLWSHQSYRVKPHGQLVLVSLTHYCASTPNLSTSWSTTTLQGAQGPGKTHLETSFPLRCFQRLSLPHLATRQCHWRDNRYTRGVSTPVLSY